MTINEARILRRRVHDALISRIREKIERERKDNERREAKQKEKSNDEKRI